MCENVFCSLAARDVILYTLTSYQFSASYRSASSNFVHFLRVFWAVLFEFLSELDVKLIFSEWKVFAVLFMEMLHYLRLAVLLTLCAAVCGKDLECNRVENNLVCWNSTTHKEVLCLRCVVENHQISANDRVISITPRHANGTVAAVAMVALSDGGVTQMPTIFDTTNYQQFVQVELWSTNRVLNAQFFENSGKNLIYFSSWKNKLTVMADAFQNCPILEYLRLHNNGITSIPPHTFRGRHTLIWLGLDLNELTLVLNDWFEDLGNLEVLSLNRNKLVEIPDNAFKTLTKLKKLDLFGNKIEFITRKMVKHNEQLQVIGLWENKIKQIQVGTFAHLSHLTLLDARWNNCTDSYFKDQTLEQIATALTPCYSKSCAIPQIQNGHVVSIEHETTLIPGDTLEPYNSAKVVCHPNFIQFHEKEIQPANKCLEDDWRDEDWPECYSE